MERTQATSQPISIEGITVGVDPEFFLFTKKGEPISAHDIVPGTKTQPYKLKGGGTVQADGTAVELGIAPCNTSKQFVMRIRRALSDIRKMVPPELEFKFIPSVEYKPAYFASLPTSATELGCNPDYQALNQCRRSIIPKDTGTLRTGAGHIHVGWGRDKDIFDPGHLFDCSLFVQSLDGYFKAFAHMWDNDTQRIKLYGANGAFRPKPYGVEYRGLSNAWLNYPELWPWLFHNTRTIFSHLLTTGVVVRQQHYDRCFYDTATNTYKNFSTAECLAKLNDIFGAEKVNVYDYFYGNDKQREVNNTNRIVGILPFPVDFTIVSKDSKPHPEYIDDYEYDDVIDDWDGEGN